RFASHRRYVCHYSSIYLDYFKNIENQTVINRLKAGGSMMKSSSIKKAELLDNTIIIIILLIFGIILIAPFLWMLSVGFDRTGNITMPFPPRLIPEEPSLFNYGIVFETGRVFEAYLNSAIVTISSVFLTVSSALLAGYAFSKGTFKFKKLL